MPNSSAEGLSKGAYIISSEQKEAQLIIIATGSEVSLAVEAQQALLKDGCDVRVVSMPSWELFEAQSEEYKKEILSLPFEKRISVEMLSTFGWDKYAHYHMGLHDFGASGPAKDVIKKFDFTTEHLVNLCEDIIK